MIDNPKKIENFFRQYYKELCFVSYQFVGDIYDAEDIVQDVFVTIINQGNTLEIQNLNAYFHRAVRNASIKKLQRTKKLISLDDKILDSYDFDDSKETEINKSEKWDFINNRINKLPPKCRKIFLLCVLNGMKYKEVAASQDVSINTVKTQIKKAYKLLRNSLEEVNLFLLFYP